jgi:DNA repair protein RadC
MDAVKNYPKAINNWPKNERPRERLIKFGANKLSDTELLAVLLRIGSNGQSAVDLSRELINQFGSFRNIESKSFSKLKRKGLGIAKIAQIKAAIEIGKRFFNEKSLSLTKTKVKASKDIVELFHAIFKRYEKRSF